MKNNFIHLPSKKPPSKHTNYSNGMNHQKNPNLIQILSHKSLAKVSSILFPSSLQPNTILPILNVQAVTLNINHMNSPLPNLMNLIIHKRLIIIQLENSLPANYNLFFWHSVNHRHQLIYQKEVAIVINLNVWRTIVCVIKMEWLVVKIVSVYNVEIHKSLQCIIKMNKKR